MPVTRHLSKFLQAIMATAVIGFGVGSAKAETLGIEINKVEDVDGGGCRTFFLFRNKTDLTLEAFEMSLAILDGNGIIDRLLTIDAAPLPSSRTTLKLFEIPELSCDNISEILLHEVSACKPQNSDPIDCFTILDISSRTPAPFVK